MNEEEKQEMFDSMSYVFSRAEVKDTIWMKKEYSPSMTLLEALQLEVEKHIDKSSNPSDNNDFKKVCSKCGVDLSEYAIDKNLCNRCSVGMPISKPISKSSKSFEDIK